MRTFANFLYIGNLYESVPGPAGDIRTMHNRVFRPVLTLVEEDCGTKLGTTEAISSIRLVSNDACNSSSQLSSSLNGKIDLRAGDVPLVIPAIQAYELAGVTSVKIRSLASCTSVDGICRKCLWASYEFLYPEFDRQTIEIVSEYPDLFAVATDSRTPVLVPEVGKKVKLDFIPNTTPFLSYISRSYSGSVLGMKTYINDRLPIREGLYESYLLKENMVSNFFRKVEDSGVVGLPELEYSKSIHSPLEKVLFLLAQYSFGYYFNASN